MIECFSLSNHLFCLLCLRQIIAIYVPDVKQRQIFLDILTMAQSLSFGNRHKGLFDIVRQCWDIYDDEQMYPSGIAPWRELMAASGVSMCI